MSQAPRLRESVLSARARLSEGRDKLQQQHARGLSGIHVSASLTDLFDSLVLDLHGCAVDDLGDAELANEVALVAHGGYGRRDVAPYSDVDLMILHAPGAQARVAPLAARMVRDVFDLGLTLGQSVRTSSQACKLARSDAVVCTSLIESRLLAGNEALFQRFAERFRQQCRRRAEGLLCSIERARNSERAQFGETVYLLEPNVKRSRGGLRDLQMLRWIGFARYGTADPDGLRLAGELAQADFERIERAREFLLRLRNEMHFHARKANDVLDRHEQLRLAEVLNFQADDGLLPVEVFMREYFEQTSGASRVVTRFAASAHRGPRLGEWISPLFSHQFERDFRVGRSQISANERGLAKLHGELGQILRLADLANLYDKSIAHATGEAIRASVDLIPEELSSEMAERFISLLSRTTRLGELLRWLHELGILEKIIPAFTHARSLLQFNEYHKYTVDEHSIRAVEKAVSFLADTGPLGWVYGHIKRKWLLHLALLIHDLGKGFPEDHSEVGQRIAEETARRLFLSDSDREVLRFLVHKHLLMAHLAFRRDTSDEQLVVRFAVEVGSPETLQMLFVLTAADMGAVGPDVLNKWKIEVLADLFQRAFSHLASDTQSHTVQQQLLARREQVLPLMDLQEDPAWFERQFASLPSSYVLSSPAVQVAELLTELRRITPGEVVTSARFLPESKAVEYRVGTYENVTPGVFHKLTGALTSQGLEILSAEIHTLADGLIFDRFFVRDPDFATEPPAERIQDVHRALRAALLNPAHQQPTFRRLWRPGEQRAGTPLAMPTQVRVDNSTSDRFTILDIFAADRTGLLYTIAKTIFQLGLSVAGARIGTYLDQVVDVFYVSDEEGAKVEDEARLREIRQRLLADIDEFERQQNQQTRNW